MTQFCLLSGRNLATSPDTGLSLHPAAEAPFEREVAATLLVPLSDLWVPAWRGDCVDTVLIKSRSAILDGKAFEETDAFAFFREIGRIGNRVVCWYADYFQDLPRVERSDEILGLVKAAIDTEDCELYLDAILDRSIA